VSLSQLFGVELSPLFGILKPPSAVFLPAQASRLAFYPNVPSVPDDFPRPRRLDLSDQLQQAFDDLSYRTSRWRLAAAVTSGSARSHSSTSGQVYMRTDRPGSATNVSWLRFSALGAGGQCSATHKQPDFTRTNPAHAPRRRAAALAPHCLVRRHAAYQTSSRQPGRARPSPRCPAARR
jgi:hypothetical protein